MAEVNTEGGASVGGDVGTDGGPFVGRNARGDTVSVKTTIQNQDADYHYIALDTKITNVHAEMINRFLILDNQRDAARDRNSELYDELREEVRELKKAQAPAAPAGPPWMLRVLAIIMVILIAVMLYGIMTLKETVRELKPQSSPVEIRR